MSGEARGQDKVAGGDAHKLRMASFTDTLVFSGYICW